MTVDGLDGELRGRHVVLRAFRPEEFEAVWKGHRRLEPMVMPVPPDRERLRRRVAGSGSLRNGEIDLAVEVDGRLIGTIQTHNVQSRALRPGVFELGILIWSPEDRGKGHGSEAMALLTTWLFEHAGARRVQAGTGAANSLMRRALEKLGFTDRGFVQGPGREYVLYAVTGETWRIRAALPDGGNP